MTDKTTPTVGDPLLLHGVRCTVTSVGGAGGRITAAPVKDPASVSHTMMAGDLQWHEKHEAWTLPGRILPDTPGRPAKLVRGPAPEET